MFPCPIAKTRDMPLIIWKPAKIKKGCPVQNVAFSAAKRDDEKPSPRRPNNSSPTCFGERFNSNQTFMGRLRQTHLSSLAVVEQALSVQLCFLVWTTPQHSQHTAYLMGEVRNYYYYKHWSSDLCFIFYL